MTQQPRNAPQPDPVLQRGRFREWLKRIIAQLQAVNGWTLPQIAAAGSISVDTLYTWKREGDTWPDGKPKPGTVANFCVGLDLEPLEPFEILGWIPPSLREPQPVTPPLAKELARFLIDPNVDKAEKRAISLAVERLLAPYRRRPPEEPGEPAA